jgi:hypothetical protein
VDSSVSTTYLNLEAGEIYEKSQTGSNKNFLYYFNLILIPTSKTSNRRVYTVMDVLGSVGGILKVLAGIIAVLLTPFTYKIT